MSSEVHIRSDELCERCLYGDCGVKCTRGDDCPLNGDRRCRCDGILPGTPCPYFEEAASKEVQNG